MRTVNIHEAKTHLSRLVEQAAKGASFVIAKAGKPLVKVILDTRLLLWAADHPKRLSAAARKLLGAPNNEPVFSAVSIWEIVIKRGLGRADFRVDPHQLRRGLLDNGYSELAIAGEHTLAVDTLPAIHGDPFDRLLVAQSLVEGIPLVTADPIVAKYPGPVRLV
jgi:PIN domain nuclease of toxin-antitoxin system